MEKQIHQTKKELDHLETTELDNHKLRGLMLTILKNQLTMMEWMQRQDKDTFSLINNAMS